LDQIPVVRTVKKEWSNLAGSAHYHEEREGAGAGVPFMTKAQQSFSRDIQALFDAGASGELTDRQLLERFKARDDEAAERAFAVLVERHGPMVLRACHSILRDRHAGEDAFQATFLILSRKAGSLWFRDSLGPWLYGVACRVAQCARATALRRQTHEQKAAELATLTANDETWDDRDAVLYEELNRLPERYRLAVLMCDVEGLTQEQAARRLGWPAGTVRSRLARGRGRLRNRLTRRGLAPALVPLGASLAPPAVPASLAALTAEAAVRFGAGPAALGTVASAIALSEGVMSVMFMSKLKLILAVAITSGFIVSGTTVLGYRAMGLRQVAPAEANRQPKNQVVTQADPNAPAPPGLESLSSIAQARLDVARRIRDNMQRLFLAGQLDELSFLSAQRRYDDVVDAVAVKNDAGRVRFGEVRVAELKHVEQNVRKQFSNGERSEIDVLAVESDRLEAEHTLAKAKAKFGAAGKAVRARVEVAKRLRDATYKRFKGGLAGAEEYLVWQKRYHDLAYAVVLIDGGDRIQFFEGRLAELKRVEQLMSELFDKGQIQQSDVDIVQYYRLEADEALATAKAEIGEVPDQAVKKD
jgi:RNA polymerase sigma factor (sigma-70 family)